MRSVKIILKRLERKFLSKFLAAHFGALASLWKTTYPSLENWLLGKISTLNRKLTSPLEIFCQSLENWLLGKISTLLGKLACT